MSMRCLHIPNALPLPLPLPSLSPINSNSLLSISSQHKTTSKQAAACNIQESGTKILGLAVQVGGFLATVAAEPAFGVTGVNEEEDLVWTLIQLGISAFFYFLFVPPILMNWLRIRWYRRNLAEMYVQFMFVFLFFPGVLLWAPFLNFRKFPRDPSMKYPWSTPQDPSKIKGGFLKYPWAKPEDYQV